MTKSLQSFFMILTTGAFFALFMFAMVLALSDIKPDFAKSPVPTGYIVKADITKPIQS